MTGRYIVLEGGEGTGKGTQAKLLLNRLGLAGIKNTWVREPGGEALAEVVRSLLKQDPADPRWILIRESLVPEYRDWVDMTPWEELLFFCYARSRLIRAVIKPKLRAGFWVISDRNYLSSLAYQCYAAGVDLETGRLLCRLSMHNVEADKTLILSVADRQETERRRAQRQQTDRFEAKSSNFHRVVNEAYMAEAELQGFAVIEAVGSPKVISDQIWKHVEPLLKEAFDERA